MHVNHFAQKMRALLSVLLTCTIILNGCISSFETQANARLTMLKADLQNVPTIPGGELLDSQENIVPSRVPRCATVDISQLYGTNTLTFQEVIKWYTANLNSSEWRLNSVGAGGAVYTGSREVSLGISDGYRWLPSMKKSVQQGQARFKTLFLVGLNAFVEPDMTLTRCT